MHLMFSAFTALIALIVAFCHGQNSISHMLMKGMDSAEFLAEYHKHEIQGRMICGMSRFYPNKDIIFYHEFAVYDCVRGKPRLLTCFGNLVSPSNYTHSAVESTHYCRQFANQYLYSDEPDDQMHIWTIEKLICEDQQISEQYAKFFAFYNYKLLSCKDNKYHLEACVLNTGIVLADSNIGAQLNMSTHHKDICYQLAIQTATPIEEIFFNADPYTGVEPMLDDANKLKKFARWNRLHSTKNIQNFHKSLLCDHLKMKIVFYEFGLFECKNNNLALLYCLYGDKTVDVDSVINSLRKETGDYIDDPKDLRFCGQIAILYRVTGKSHDQQLMWKHEDFVCDRLRSQVNNLKAPQYTELVQHLSKWHLYQSKIKTDRSSGYAVYHNFQVMECDPFKKLPFIIGCLFDSKYFPLENAMEELQKNDVYMDENHRDFCFELGKISMLIKGSVITRREEHLEADQKLNFSVNPWKGNTVSYYINPEVSSNERTRLDIAIKEYEKYTCLKFKRLHEENLKGNYIDIAQERRKCESSWRGMFEEGKSQKMIVGPTCNILYLLGLSIGLIDEYQRPDRDRWITFNPAVVQEANKISDRNAQYYSLTNHPAYHNEMYDFQSLFHGHQNTTFLETAFKNYRFEIKDKPFAKGLTYCDVAKVNRFYQCNPRIYLTNCEGLHGDISPLVTHSYSAIDAQDTII